MGIEAVGIEAATATERLIGGPCDGGAELVEDFGFALEESGKEGVEVMIAPIGMDISLLEKAKYTGANTDDLDFPFAIVRWNKAQGAFVQDQEYTLDMQRTNGAILLMAGRVEKRSH